MSFNPACIHHLARLAPHLPRGITTSAYDADDWHPLPAATCDHLRDIPDYAATGASFISHEAADLSRPRVTALKAAGAAILCWTIRSAAEEAAARHIADNVTFEGYFPPGPLDRSRLSPTFILAKILCGGPAGATVQEP